MKRPAYQFYPADWLKDTRACSLAARGLWADMLAYMHNGAPYGHLAHANGSPIAPSSLAKMVGAPRVSVERLLKELGQHGLYSVSSAGVIFSRRMVRDEATRNKRASGGHHSLDNPNVPKPKEGPPEGPRGKGSLTPSSGGSLGGSPSSSAASSSSDSKPENYQAPLPVGRAVPSRTRARDEKPDLPTGRGDLASRFSNLQDVTAHFPDRDVDLIAQKLLADPSCPKDPQRAARALWRWCESARKHDTERRAPAPHDLEAERERGRRLAQERQP